MFFYIQDEIMIQVDVNVNIASMHDKLEIWSHRNFCGFQYSSLAYYSIKGYSNIEIRYKVQMWVR
jgi:hypothetical protein